MARGVLAANSGWTRRSVVSITTSCRDEIAGACPPFKLSDEYISSPPKICHTSNSAVVEEIDFLPVATSTCGLRMTAAVKTSVQPPRAFLRNGIPNIYRHSQRARGIYFHVETALRHSR